MSYTISLTDTTKPDSTITVEDGTINNETSLRLPGRNSTAYGAVIAENFLHLLENFANSSEPSNPIEGQMWYDTNPPEQLKVYNGTQWVPASGITKSISTPGTAQVGDLWVDTDNQQLYLWTGSGWILPPCCVALTPSPSEWQLALPAPCHARNRPDLCRRPLRSAP